MSTVFSHIIQKRLSEKNEDVATDALCYVLESSEAARRGMMKLLQGIVPDLPSLWFKSQQSIGSIRPDMWGFAGINPRVFVENKFWAGLTDNQPVSYLKELAQYAEDSVLLVIAPAARENTLWREMIRRLGTAEVSYSGYKPIAGAAHLAKTQLGPILALTSWTTVLSALEYEAVNDHSAKADIDQLRALCEAADLEAFAPASATELSDQRLPAFILQLGALIQPTVELAVAENVLSINGLRPQASYERIGRYAWIPDKKGAGAWLGVHFGFWKSHGSTPLWLLFVSDNFGRKTEVARLIEPWAAKTGILTATNSSTGEFAIALDMLSGEERPAVMRHLVDQIKTVAAVLEDLPPRIPDTEPTA